MRTVFTASKRTLLITACALGLEIALFTSLIMLSLRSLNSSRAELARAKQELSVVRNEANQLTDLRRQKALCQVRLQRLEPAIKPGKGNKLIPTLMVQLYDLGKRSGATISAVRPTQSPAPTSQPAQQQAAAAGSQPRPATSFEVRKVSVDMTATFAQLHKFLEGLATFPKPVEVANLQIRPVAQEPGRPARLGVGFELNCYTVYEEV
ncbi:MAG: hypothetical protein ACUVTZ_07915, partial [Armatimonadota bacterium]